MFNTVIQPHGQIGGLFVITQGVLGGITVLFLLPTPVSVAHACLAQAFLCLTVALALLTAPSWERMRSPAAYEEPALRLLTAATVTALGQWLAEFSPRRWECRVRTR